MTTRPVGITWKIPPVKTSVAQRRRRLAVWFLVLVLAYPVGAALNRLRYRTEPIPDVATPTELTLGDPSDSRLVHAVMIWVVGTIDGEADLVLFNSTTPVRVKGKVNATIQNDCYMPTCTLQYKPVAVTRGSLEVRYRFKS